MTHRSEVYGEAIKMLDALPEGSVLLDSDGDAWQKQGVRWTSVSRGANTELMGSNSLAILTPLTVVHHGLIAPHLVLCPECRGEGATYEQVRVGQHATPFVCGRCDGDGEVPEKQDPERETDV